MTKTEYRQYLGSSHWQAKRKHFLSYLTWCQKCQMPRYLAIIAYDQDLHVHHVSYANLGNENEDTDLMALCRRCHELETFGKTKLKAPWSTLCTACGDEPVYNRFALYTLCEFCLIGEHVHAALGGRQDSRPGDIPTELQL